MSSKISALPAATSVQDADILPVVQGGVNVKASRGVLLKGGTAEDISLVASTGQRAAVTSSSGNSALDVFDSESIGGSTTGAIQFSSGSGQCIMSLGSVGQFTLEFSSASTLSIHDPAVNVKMVMDPVVKTVFILALNGVDSTFVPPTPGDWNGVPPVTNTEAVQRCAALLKSLNGGVGP